MIDRILLDLDGVIVDFLKGAQALHGKSYPGHPHDPQTQVEQTPWAIEPIWGLSPQELWAPLDRSFWSNLEPLPGMSAIISELETRFGEENICLLTSPIRTDGCIDGKMDWITR